MGDSLDGGGDFEPLPSLSEDEDSCLTEEDIWAICLECSKSLKSIAHSAIFQTLCITPDTLAFNTNGNVCFMKQISDDPEGTFMPPEIDVTGNTFAAHIFSLGATLAAVVEYMMEPEIDSECSQDLHTLLEKMQEENPEDRPDIEDVISLCEEKLKLSSSNDICQCLSAIGRTVLSIESCGIFQDSCDNLWKRQDNQNISLYEQHRDENLRNNSSPDAEDLKAESARNSSDICTMNYQSEDIKGIKNNLVDKVFCHLHISTQITKCEEEEEESTEYKLEAKPHTHELGTDVLTKNCLRKVETFSVLPFESEPEPRTFFPITIENGLLRRNHNQLQPKSLSSTSNNEDTSMGRKLSGGDRSTQLESKAAYFQGTDNYLEEFYLSPKLSCLCQHHVTFCDDSKADFQPYSHTVAETPDNCGILSEPDEPHPGYKRLEDYEPCQYCGENYPSSNEKCVLGVNMTTMFTELNKNGYSSSLLNSPELNVTERRDYYIEDMQCEGRKPEIKNNEQCVFLKHLLMWYGKPLKDYELWALCHECLLTLETYTDYPAYLCLDSVMINCDGSILFVPPKSEGSYDMFYLAPEISEEDFVTEKVCIYCIAAILWRAAKCNFPPDRKLVLPRKLKNFLLHMARRKSEDRPSLADAIKTCGNYLLEQSINSKKVLAFLPKYAFQAFKEVDSFNDSLPFDFQSEKNSVDDNLGFLPMNNESKLIAVKGPVPCQLPLNRGSTSLPNAFTSSATHFKPIIVHQNTDSKKNTTASVMVQHETTVEGVVPVNKKNSMHLQIETENEEIEDCDMPATCMTPDILAYDTQKYSKTSSSMDKLPLLSKSSCVSQEMCISQSPSSSISNCTVPSNMTFIKNFLLKQDPETRVLTLVPVQIAVSEQISNKPLHSKTAYSCSSLHVLLSDSIVSCAADKALHHKSSVNNLRNCKHANEFWDTKAQINSFPSATINKETQTKCSEMDASHILSNESSTAAETSVPLLDHTSHTYMDQNSASPVTLGMSYENNGINEAILKNMVHLMKEEFSFSGFCKNTDEVLAIGKYIFGLKDLQYNTFRTVISEEFCDFYWEEKLLANLYDAANGRSPLSVKMDETKNGSKTFQGQNKPKDFLNTGEETNDDLPQDYTENEVRREMEGEYLQTNTTYISPGLPEDNQSQKEFIVHREENIYTGMSCLSELSGFCPGWRSAFYSSECFSLEVHDHIRKLGKRKDGTQNIGAKIMELEQQIMIETKNYSKSRRFYYRLLHKERRSKGGEVKTILPKLKGQLEEMRAKVQFLELVKKYLQIINTEKWGVESCSLLTVVNMARSETLSISSLDSMLLFYNINKNLYNKSQCNNSQYQPRNLQAGTPLGLMAYLYCRNSFLEGYVQQFLFTFRYFCSQEELLQFILDRIIITLPSSSPESCSLLSKIYFRSFSILQTWIEDCYAVDFAVNPDFMSTLKEFIISKVVPLSGYGKWLLSWLDLITRRKESDVSQCLRKEDWKEVEEPSETQSLRSSCKKLSKSILQKSFNWRSSKGNEAIVPYQKDKQHNIASALPKECFTNGTDGFCARIDGGQYFLTEYTAQQLCCQLTLLQQEMFHKCHPVHFLNSRFLGVKDKSVPLQKTTSSELLPTQIYNLFVETCVQDDYLVHLLKYADNVSTWVAAEIVTSYSSKAQVNLLTKFLCIAKCCYEQRNFATTIQILNGLENLVVRQLPVWKCLPSKILEIMEELKAVEVFLKSDSLCLMEGERFKTSPTIPSAYVLAMHIQQLETGGFTMRNGTYKWTKLRNIAKVVSQVHAFQENSYTFPPDHQLQSFVRHRIASFNDADISALAAVNSANFHQIPAEKQSRKIQDTLHRMKTMFQ
ncbi:kinase non-catalytic C-lobe domain-containing protein 1 isoform X2 [Sceloporus undulatus]|uniref:kinase non-catalytic C-lobe domain-containing protein 1 isoform X2 n=1 Tax=Sceloporus undulatus TaxID=8520 RepID=UPI001C4BBE9B|nr:kinase non-catalytic C-lobe domain-containing protein 1 isoform X2 [Sceloporus undulatus]